MRLIVCITAALIVLLPGVATAQQSTGAPASASSVSQAGRPAVGALTEAEALARMRAALRNLVTAEEKYWADHGSYTTDLSALGLFGRDRKPSADSAYAQVIFAGGRGWTGMALHRALRGKTCVIAVGIPSELPKLPETASEHLVPTDDGAPRCDGDVAK